MTPFSMIDFSDLKSMPIDATVESFTLKRDNFLSVTAYDDCSSVVLTMEGNIVRLMKPLKKCLKEYCEVYHINQHELSAHYKQVSCSTKALVHGRYLIIPTHGATNPNVVYYNDFYIDSSKYLDESSRMLLSFKNDKGVVYKILVDASERTFNRIRESAHYVSKNQLDICYEYMYQLGIIQPDQLIVNNYGSHLSMFKLIDNIKIEQITDLVNTTYKRVFGSEADEEFLKELLSLIKSSKFF
ncbi:MAG: hypothetical protein Q3959_06475 [Limosilactobacillus sp.]|uniref:hypothetical protein n=1 Tax=Limosilactobacillus sp. TaxID=2773925 RepID=UPI0027020910|nr:hypothetical protein [Limosilactobacillus sp.]